MFFILFILFGCDRESFYQDENYFESLKEALKDCDSKEIAFLAKKNRIQTAFENCGSNNFSQFSWAPSGVYLYFQLFSGSYIMNGENKGVDRLPLPEAIDNASWINANLLAIPVGPAEENPEGSQRIALYNLGGMLDFIDLTIKDPRNLQSAGESKILLSGVGEDGVRHPYLLNTLNGKMERIFPFIHDNVDHFGYASQERVLGVVHDNKGKIYKDGKLLIELDKVKRIHPHPEGRYVALEIIGDPKSLMDNHLSGVLTQEQRERAIARQKQKQEQLPEWAKMTTNPPEIHLIDMENGERYRFTSFFGEKFEWYVAQDYYASYLLRGIEGKMLQQNIALMNLWWDINLLNKGKNPSGAKRLGKVFEPVSPKPVENSNE